MPPHTTIRRAPSAACWPPRCCRCPPWRRGLSQPIVLGTSAPFTGFRRVRGEEYRKGADACLAPINAAGGVQGRPVRISYLDDGYDPKRPSPTRARWPARA